MKLNILSTTLIAAAITLASCSDNEPDNSINVDFAFLNIDYDTNGVWKDFLNPDAASFDCMGVRFSHTAVAGQYAYWTGFCPSRSADVADYSDGNWPEHQWTSMSGGGLNGAGTPCLIAYWNTMETDGDEPSLKITLADNAPFAAESVYVNNTTYTYYAMVNGTPYSKKFAKGDRLNVLIYGVTPDGRTTGPVTATLADYADDNSLPINGWSMVNLSDLNTDGKLVSIYFQMQSSDSGQFGMNTPAYFAIDKLKLIRQQ